MYVMIKKLFTSCGLPTMIALPTQAQQVLHQQWTAYNTWLNTPTYQPVYDPTQATANAEAALLEWNGPNGACNLPITPGCCIAIYMCGSMSDWNTALPSFSPLGTAGYTTQFPQGSGSNCTAPCQNVSSTSPNPATDRYIMVNVTPDFLYQNTTDPSPDPSYGLHNVPNKMWFTSPGGGNSSPPIIPSMKQNGYNLLSLQELLEHEMGHWFGLNHPEAGGCSNNNNCCNAQMLATSGEMVMTDNTNTPVPNGRGKDLSSEDKLMFQKLYCPTGCDASGVEEGQAVPDFNPQYPS